MFLLYNIAFEFGSDLCCFFKFTCNYNATGLSPALTLIICFVFNSCIKKMCLLDRGIVQNSLFSPTVIIYNPVFS